MSIDHDSHTPYFLQLAAILRERITAGEYGPGQVLPSEQQLMQEFGIARVTVRQAVKELRGEGLVVVEPRRGTYVRAEVERQVVAVNEAADVSARMPTPDERRDLGIPAGVPIIVVERVGRAPELLAADRVIVKVLFEG